MKSFSKTALTGQRRACCALLPALLAACTGIDGVPSSNILIPPETLNISQSVMVPLQSIVGAGILFVVVDPLAPNWQIEQTRLDERRFRIALRKKRFTTGGDGEVMPAFNRRAEQIVRESGAARYRIVEFSEGVDSVVPVAQRVAQGVVEIVR